MADIKYKKLDVDGNSVIYGMYDRYWLLGTCTEEEIRDTLAQCESELLRADPICSDSYLKSIKRLRDSLREVLEVA